MKRGARIAAFSSGPIKRGSGAKVLLVGVVARQGQVEGILSGRIMTDGDDSTKIMLKLVSGSRFRDQVKLIALNGVALAGLNIVDLGLLKQRGYEYAVLTRYRQRPSLLIRAIRLNGGKNTEKERLVNEQAAIGQQ